MHCADVIEELATSAGPASGTLADHLASCPSCAAWARRDQRLERLWEATRPDELAPGSWATVWADLTETLAETPATTALLAPAHPWQRWGWATFGIAQAAALLVAAWLGAHPGPVVAAPAPIDIEDGRLVMIQSVGNGVKVVSHIADEGSSAVDASFVMLGKLEAMAE